MYIYIYIVYLYSDNNQISITVFRIVAKNRNIELLGWPKNFTKYIFTLLCLIMINFSLHSR